MKKMTLLITLSIVSVLFLGAPCFAKDQTITFDHYVPHISTVHANAGAEVEIFARERVLKGIATNFKSINSTGKVVLFVHGGTVSSVPDFDLPFKNYSWAEYLAQAGFDVFMMDVTGYGNSPKPEMENPCNANPAQQGLLIPNPLEQSCSPDYPFRLGTNQSDWDEIDRVVDYIRNLRAVDKVNLIGWSAGGPRAAGYAALHPEKVEKLVFLAPSPPSPSTPADPPSNLPAPGFPMSLQNSQALFENRWYLDVHCPGQVDPGLKEVLWAEIMEFAGVGVEWGTPAYDPIYNPLGGINRTRNSNPTFGWTPALASQIQMPLLIVAGEFDNPDQRILTYNYASSENKVFIRVACASHFMLWESQHMVLLQSSKDWLLHGSVKGVKKGLLSVDSEGHYTKLKD